MGRTREQKIGRNVLFLIIFILLLISASSISKRNLNPKYNVQGSIIHPKIYLSSNSDLILFPNKTGNGTPDDPYIIEDLEIDGGMISNPIGLLNIDKYLILRNLTVRRSHINEGCGIILDNCRNIAIMNCNVENNEWGINLYFSKDCNVSENYLADNYIGIICFTIENVNIQYNYIINCEGGIHGRGTNVPNYIYNNTILECGYGIQLEGGGRYFEVTKNHVSRSNLGINIIDYPFHYDDFVQIRGNTLQENTIGLELINSNKNSISENLIVENQIGIKLTESNYNDFSKNYFENNGIDYQLVDSYHNGRIVPMTWQMIGLYLVLGIVGLSNIVIGSIFIPKSIKKRKIIRLIKMGENAKNSGNNDKAMQYFNTVLKIDPTNESAQNKKIALLYEEKRFSEISDILRGVSKSKGEYEKR